MNVLLLGGVNFVGYEMGWALLRAGHRVSMLTLDPPRADLRPLVEWIFADRRNPEALCAALAGHSFDVVVDNIAFVPGDVTGLLDALPQEISHYILTSTTDCYPRHTPRTWSEDEIDVRLYTADEIQVNPYSLGKISCEAVLRGAGVPWTAFRVAPVTGVRDNLTGGFNARATHGFEYSARSHFWPPRVLDNGPIVLNQADENLIRLVWVTDVANAVCRAIADEDMVDHVYNVCGDEFWTNERLVSSLAYYAGVRVDVVHASAEAMASAGLDFVSGYGVGASWSLSSNAKLRATGWQPTPPAVWMPMLLEAYGRPFMRTGYHTRIKEVALARRIQRLEAQTSAPGPARLRLDEPAAAQMPARRVSGRHSRAASNAWKARVLDQSLPVRPAPWTLNETKNGVASRIGIGTAHGDVSDEVDQQYLAALVRAASGGINVIDTAINYRAMRAERTVGRAIARLQFLDIPREALIVCSKGGMITADSQDGRSWSQYLHEELVAPGIIESAELRDLHGLSAPLIERQLAASLDNLSLETIDVYFLHNPELGRIRYGDEAFERRLSETFLVLEDAVSAGKIAAYGLATWDGLRVPPTDPQYLSLSRVVDLAAAAAAKRGKAHHHLTTIQLPLNAYDHRSLTAATQQVGEELVSAIEAARLLGLGVLTSGTVMQGAGAEPEFWSRILGRSPGLSHRAALLRLIVSCPGVGTALVGMRRTINVDDAIGVMALPQLAEEDVRFAMSELAPAALAADAADVQSPTSPLSELLGAG